MIVSADQKLPKATDFGNGVNVILIHSRIFVCWVAAGIALGVYDNAIKYVSNRKQFGQQISGTDLIYIRLSIDSIKDCQDNGKYSSCLAYVFQSFKIDRRQKSHNRSNCHD